MQSSMFVCDEYRARSFPGSGFPCTFHADSTCAHGACKLEWLRSNGLGNVADRLARNWQARTWRGNWGRLLYDDKEHGRDPRRRNAAAKIVRAFRKGVGDYADLVRAGAWSGAVL